MTLFVGDDTYPQPAIDLTRARQLLAEAMATKGPDFVYNPGGLGDCFYVPSPLPRDEDGYVVVDRKVPSASTGCLVGVALSLAEVDVSEFSVETISYLAQGELDGVMTAQAVEYFRKAQALQDRGHTWGVAYAAAEEEAANA